MACSEHPVLLLSKLKMVVSVASVISAILAISLDSIRETSHLGFVRQIPNSFLSSALGPSVILSQSTMARRS